LAEGKRDKKKRTKSLRPRLADRIGMILEDEDLSRVDASIQAHRLGSDLLSDESGGKVVDHDRPSLSDDSSSAARKMCQMMDASIQAALCNCDISDAATMVASRSRDACVQANLCHCSEYVSCIAVKQESETDTTHKSAVAHPVAYTSMNSQLPEIKSEPSKVVDVDGICSELEACDLDDTVPYEYGSVLVDCTGSVNDQTNVPEGVNRTVSKMTSTSEPDAGQSDGVVVSMSEPDACQSDGVIVSILKPDTSQSESVLVSMYDISLQTSAVENVIDTGVGVRDMPDAETDDALPSVEDKVSESAVCGAGFTASPLLPLPSDASGAEVVRSLGNLFSGSCKKSVRDLFDAETEDALPSVEDKVSESAVCSAGFTASPLLPQPSDANKTEVVHSVGNLFSDSYDEKSVVRRASLHASAGDDELVNDVSELWSDTSVNDKLVNEVFEGPAAVCTVTSPEMSAVPAIPDFDDASDQEMRVESDLLSDESDGKVVDHDRPSPSDDSSSAARKILTSTTVGSPVTISNFGFAVSSLSGSDQSPRYSVGGRRRKSKPGRRRVSMCGEYDSPTEFFTPHRVTEACELTTVADTDEDENDTVPNANLYTTAVEECVLDTTSETDSDSEHESLNLVDGCVPDSPVEPYQNTSSLDESVPCQPAVCKLDSAQPAPTECSVDTSAQHNSTMAAVDGRLAKSVVLSASGRNVQGTCCESEDLVEDDLVEEDLVEHDVPFDEGGAAKSRLTDDKNRFEQNVLLLVFLSDLLEVVHFQVSLSALRLLVG